MLTSTLGISTAADLPVDPATIPVVPVEVLTKGNQGVGHYLMMNVDYVTTELGGPSVVSLPGQSSRRFNMDELVALGYRHRGSFTELSKALSGAPYSISVVRTPDGFYDVRLDLTYHTADGRKAMTGSGWLYIDRAPDGRLIVGRFDPSVSINTSVAVHFTNTIGAAKWVPRDGGKPEDLPVSNDNDVIVPGKDFENGYLVVADQNGDVSAWDLESGNKIVGDRVTTLLGKVSSGDFYPLFDTIEAGNLEVYKIDGQVYAHIPTIETVLSSAFVGSVDLSITPWGTKTKIHPTAVYVTPVSVDGPPSAFQIDKESDVLSANSLWSFALPGGIYHVRRVYPGIKDFSSLTSFTPIH